MTTFNQTQTRPISWYPYDDAAYMGMPPTDYHTSNAVNVLTQTNNARPSPEVTNHHPQTNREDRELNFSNQRTLAAPPRSFEGMNLTAQQDPRRSEQFWENAGLRSLTTKEPVNPVPLLPGQSEVRAIVSAGGSQPHHGSDISSLHSQRSTASTEAAALRAKALKRRPRVMTQTRPRIRLRPSPLVNTVTLVSRIENVREGPTWGLPTFEPTAATLIATSERPRTRDPLQVHVLVQPRDPLPVRPQDTFEGMGIRAVNVEPFKLRRLLTREFWGERVGT